MIHSLVHREADFAPSSVRGIVYLPCRPVSAEALRCGGRGRFSSWKAGVAQHGHGVGRHEDEVNTTPLDARDVEAVTGIQACMKTYTPDLDPAVLGRLRDYAALFAEDFPQAKPARWAGVYLQGLLLDGERKSIEPLSRQVTLPEGLPSKDPEQALQQFVNQSPRDEHKVLRRYRARMAEAFASPAGIFVIDDTSFPKQGRHSVGVQRQYCGALGKKANCQVAPSVHYVSPRGHYPLDLRLYLPDSWLSDPKRLDQAG